MTITRYCLARPGTVPLGLLAAALMLGLGVWAILSGVGADQPLGYRAPFWAAWFSILLFIAYRQATCAREIVVHENNEVEFVSMLRRVRVPAQAILSVKTTGGEHDHLVVRHQAGAVHLAGPFNEFHQFLTELRRVNPGVEYSGC